MDNQTFREKIIEEHRQYYMENPEVESWVNRKRALRIAVLIFWALHSGLAMFLMAQSAESTGIAREAASLLFQLFLLFGFMNPEGSWRINIVLYLWAMGEFFVLARDFGAIVESFPIVLFMPMLAAVELMEILTPFLLLGAAMYLTLPASHRRLSEEVEMHNKDVSDRMRQLMQ